MIKCKHCGEPIQIEQALVLWNDDAGADAVVVHKGKCDQKEYRKSSGAAFGRNWYKREDVVRRLGKLNPGEQPGLIALNLELKRLHAI